MSASNTSPSGASASVMESLEPRQLLSTTYYLSPSGANNNDGTSPAEAWKTIQKVNQQSFEPGDTILFEGGATFSGGLIFEADDDGVSGQPIRVGSYGSGRATISSGTQQALEIHNTDWFEVSDLVFVGAGRTTSSVDGVTAWNSLGGSQWLEHLRFNNIEARGFGKNGLAIGGEFGSKGFRDVRVTNSVVRDNAISGMMVWGTGADANQDVYIGHVTARDNAGVAGAMYVSGNGITVEGTTRATIERSTAFNNGFAGNGGVGIWCYSSDQVVIQYNESYNNRTGGVHDGGGFALDGGTTNSTLQYNYSHGNHGAAIGLYQFFGAREWGNNIVRYNVSENDGRKNFYGAITAWNGNGENGLNGAHIYGNTVFMSPQAGASPHAIRFSTGTNNFKFRNNLFVTTGAVRFITNSAAHTGLAFQQNNWWSSGSSFQLLWNGTVHNNLASWRSASGQETLNGNPTGLSVDPKLTNPGGGGTIGNPDNLTSLSAYKLLGPSPMIDAGLNLQSLFGTTPVPDFWGDAVPGDAGWDIGAHEGEKDDGGGGGGGGGGGDATINFENVSTGSLGTGGYNDPSGYRIVGQPAGGGVQTELIVHGTGQGFTTKVLQNANWNQKLIVSRLDGADFDIASLDYAAGRWGEAGDGVVTGFLAGGGTQTRSFSFSGKGLQRLTLDWESLSRIEINFAGGANAAYGTVDNLIFGEGGGAGPANFENLSTGSLGAVVYSDPSGFNFASLPGGGGSALGELVVHGTGQGFASKMLQPGAWGRKIVVNRADSAAFALTSFAYAAGRWGEAGDATVTGFFANGTTQTTSYSFNSKAAQTLTLNWANLTRVEINFSGGANAAYGTLDSFVFA